MAQKPDDKIKLQRKIIEFLRTDENIDAWWIQNKKNYTMDFPMMLVSDIEHLLTNYNNPKTWHRTQQ